VGKPLVAVRPPIWVAATAMVTGALPLVVLGLPSFLAVPWTSLGATTWALLVYVSAFALAVN